LPYINAETECIKNKQLLHGKVILTNYRLAFVPSDPNVYKNLDIRRDYFNIPLGLIAKYFYKE